MDEARKIPGVKQVCIVHDVGYELTEIHSSSDRMGFVIVQAEYPQEAIEYCEQALSKIKVIAKRRCGK